MISTMVVSPSEPNRVFHSWGVTLLVHSLSLILYLALPAQKPMNFKTEAASPSCALRFILFLDIHLYDDLYLVR